MRPIKRILQKFFSYLMEILNITEEAVFKKDTTDGFHS